MKLKIESQERCLGQITRVQLHPEIVSGRGNCEICNYDFVNNSNCAAYRIKESRVYVRIFEIVE
jgi:hypothetical protein